MHLLDRYLCAEENETGVYSVELVSLKLNFFRFSYLCTCVSVSITVMLSFKYILAKNPPAETYKIRDKILWNEQNRMSERNRVYKE